MSSECLHRNVYIGITIFEMADFYLRALFPSNDSIVQN